MTQPFYNQSQRETLELFRLRGDDSMVARRKAVAKLVRQGLPVSIAQEAVNRMTQCFDSK